MLSVPIMHVTLLVLLVSVMKPKTTLAAIKADYYQLYEDIFGQYKANVRPAINETHPIHVAIALWVHSIIDIDEKEQTVTTSGTIWMSWDDNYLAWDPAQYGDIVSLLVPQKILFLPDIIVSNSITATDQLGYPQMYVRLNNDGFIDWGPTSIIETSCDIDITYFPFDTQVCYIEFGTSMSNPVEILIKLENQGQSVILDQFSPNGQWQLLSLSEEAISAEGHKTLIRFGLLLKRRRVFYVLSIVLPVFFLSLTSSLVFALPADEGEKMGTGITILLSFAVYLTIVSDLVPNTSLQVSILGVYLTTLLGLSAISVVVVAFTLRLNFRDEEIPVGPKTTRFILMLQRLTCSRKEGENVNRVTPVQRENTTAATQDKDSGCHTTSTRHLFMNNETKVELSWKQVAKTLDDFFFILFSTVSVLVTLFCLLTLTIGGENNAPQVYDPIPVNEE